jgi:hypothetical protein
MPVLSILLCSTGQLSLHLQRGRCVIRAVWVIKLCGLLDEFSLGDIKGEITAGKNKYGYLVSNTTMHSTLIIYCCS